MQRTWIHFMIGHFTVLTIFCWSSADIFYCALFLQFKTVVPTREVCLRTVYVIFPFQDCIKCLLSILVVGETNGNDHCIIVYYFDIKSNVWYWILTALFQGGLTDHIDVLHINCIYHFLISFSAFDCYITSHYTRGGFWKTNGPFWKEDVTLTSHYKNRGQVWTFPLLCYTHCWPPESQNKSSICHEEVLRNQSQLPKTLCEVFRLLVFLSKTKSCSVKMLKLGNVQHFYLTMTWRIIRIVVQ